MQQTADPDASSRVPDTLPAGDAENIRAVDVPWYKNLATLISAAAFLFSFGTTIVSYRRTHEQDVQSLTVELRGLLQRLAALPKENVEAFQKYKTDPAIYQTLSGYINQENLLLAQQANYVARKLPKDRISAIDYIAVAMALQNSRVYEAAIANYKEALQVSTGLTEDIGALRGLGSLEALTGRMGDARGHFQKALDIWSKYPGYDPFTKTQTDVETEIAWGWAEAFNNDSVAANQHFARASQMAEGLPPSQGKDFVVAEANQAKSNFSAPKPNSSGPVPAPLSVPGAITQSNR